MTKDGAYKCFALLNMVYQNQFNYKERELLALSQEWTIQFKMFEDIDVYKAIQGWISISRYLPTIADIKSMILELEEEDDLSGEEAWSLVYSSGTRANYYAQEEWNKLPDSLKKIVSKDTLKQIANADNGSLRFIKKDFLESYKGAKESLKRKLLLKNQPYNTRLPGTKESAQIENKTELQQRDNNEKEQEK